MTMTKKEQDIEQLCVNTIRTLSMDAVQEAESGHPGMPMGMADAAHVLWTKFLKHNPEDPEWFNRDRFVLSAGHGSMLLYSLLHLTGYDLSLQEIKDFRQWGSITPGHPEYGLTPGVETTTGPLGQGFATGVGMAMAEAHLAARFNTDDHQPVDHYVYGICSDGDLMEGISHEAASMAGHMKLGKIVYLYDYNEISIDGHTDLAYTEDPAKRFDAYNWHVQEVDGHNHAEVEEAIKKAQDVTDKPSIIICETHIGYGSPNKQDDASSHGAPLGEEEIKLTKEALNWPYEEKFYVPDEALGYYRSAVEKGKKAQAEWQEALEAYKDNEPEKAKQFTAFMNRDLGDTYVDNLPVFDPDSKGVASRKASGTVLNALADNIDQLVGGSADLTGSTKTFFDGKGVFSADDYTGRNVHFGVREHAMSAAVNGMALHGGVVPFGATFLIFSDYSRPAIRIAALSHIPSTFVFTHDSIGLGEDGPTHQPIEHLASLRAMPNLYVVRPADANEVSWSWKMIAERTEGPSIIVLTRQALPTIERDESNAASNVEKGAYIVSDADTDTPDVILMGSGSEVQYAYEAGQQLRDEGIAARVVSMPCWERFEEQSDEYKETVFPSDVKARISIEAASPFGWERYVGREGKIIGLDRFGESAPYEEIYEHLGLTSERLVKEAKEMVG